MSGSQAHRNATLMMSLVIAVIGVALMVQALSGGNVFSARLVLGVLFLAAGIGRLYIGIRRGRRA